VIGKQSKDIYQQISFFSRALPFNTYVYVKPSVKITSICILIVSIKIETSGYLPYSYEIKNEKSNILVEKTLTKSEGSMKTENHWVKEGPYNHQRVTNMLKLTCFQLIIIIIQ
jgi:hypothetical protein